MPPTNTAHNFNLSSFLNSMNNTDQTKGNEPLSEDCYLLKIGNYEPMKEQEYDHFLEFYHLRYESIYLRGYQEAVINLPFINNIIQNMPSINLLSQVYKAGSFIQASFQGTRTNAIKTYTGQIQHIFINDIVDHTPYKPLCHTFAYVKWYIPAVENAARVEGVVIDDFRFFTDDFHCILPIYCISSSVVIGECVNAKKVVRMVIVSILRKVYA
ncbi:hypothetical protein F4703DRAFT_1936144 [Phycomyces blakesleeanus]